MLPGRESSFRETAGESLRYEHVIAHEVGIENVFLDPATTMLESANPNQVVVVTEVNALTGNYADSFDKKNPPAHVLAYIDRANRIVSALPVGVEDVRTLVRSFAVSPVVYADTLLPGDSRRLADMTRRLNWLGYDFEGGIISHNRFQLPSISQRQQFMSPADYLKHVESPEQLFAEDNPFHQAFFHTLFQTKSGTIPLNAVMAALATEDKDYLRLINCLYGEYGLNSRLAQLGIEVRIAKYSGNAGWGFYVWDKFDTLGTEEELKLKFLWKQIQHDIAIDSRDVELNQVAGVKGITGYKFVKVQHHESAPGQTVVLLGMHLTSAPEMKVLYTDSKAQEAVVGGLLSSGGLLTYAALYDILGGTGDVSSLARDIQAKLNANFIEQNLPYSIRAVYGHGWILVQNGESSVKERSFIRRERQEALSAINAEKENIPWVQLGNARAAIIELPTGGLPRALVFALEEGNTLNALRLSSDEQVTLLSLLLANGGHLDETILGEDQKRMPGRVTQILKRETEIQWGEETTLLEGLSNGGHTGYAFRGKREFRERKLVSVVQTLLANNIPVTSGYTYLDVEGDSLVQNFTLLSAETLADAGNGDLQQAVPINLPRDFGGYLILETEEHQLVVELSQTQYEVFVAHFISEEPPVISDAARKKMDRIVTNIRESAQALKIPLAHEGKAGRSKFILPVIAMS